MGYILDVQDIFATTFPNFQNCWSTTTAKSEVDILNFCTLWDVSFFKYSLGGSLPGQCIERVCVASGTRMSVFAGWLWFQKHRGLGCFWMCKKKLVPLQWFWTVRSLHPRPPFCTEEANGRCDAFAQCLVHTEGVQCVRAAWEPPGLEGIGWATRMLFTVGVMPWIAVKYNELYI